MMGVNQSENGDHSQNLIWINKITKRFLGVYCNRYSCDYKAALHYTQLCAATVGGNQLNAQGDWFTPSVTANNRTKHSVLHYGSKLQIAHKAARNAARPLPWWWGAVSMATCRSVCTEKFSLNLVVSRHIIDFVFAGLFNYWWWTQYSSKVLEIIK